MKANEFVKKFGWGEALIAVEECRENDIVLFQHNETLESGMVDRRELERLVESWELVEKHGGLIEAKYYLHAIAVSGSDFFDVLYSAIEDVESCQ